MFPTPTPVPISTPLYPFAIPTGLPQEAMTEAVQYWNLFNSGGVMTLIQILIVIMIILAGLTLIVHQAREI